MSEGAETMPIEDYLAQGGKLTSPGNVPPRYRGELLRLMASFVDSELAASAGFAGSIFISTKRKSTSVPTEFSASCRPSIFWRIRVRRFM